MSTMDALVGETITEVESVAGSDPASWIIKTANGVHCYIDNPSVYLPPEGVSGGLRSGS
jgi:hypothetical protein